MFKSLFPTGSMFMSSGIAQAIKEDFTFWHFVDAAIKRHCQCDFGDLDTEDIQCNFEALKLGGRIFSAYKAQMTIQYNHQKIWIITEADRRATTVLFPDEY